MLLDKESSLSRKDGGGHHPPRDEKEFDQTMIARTIESLSQRHERRALANTKLMRMAEKSMEQIRNGERMIEANELRDWHRAHAG